MPEMPDLAARLKDARKEINERYRAALRSSQLAAAATAALLILHRFPEAAFLNIDESDLDDGFVPMDVVDADGDSVCDDLDSEGGLGDLVHDCLYDLPQHTQYEPVARLLPRDEDRLARLDLKAAAAIAEQVIAENSDTERQQ